MNQYLHTPPPSKPHFLVLDGLRGVAALAIVVFHFMEWVFTDPVQNFIGHGFLAVDFFFCLSGFVIGYAYDSRLPAMGLKAFFTARFIRLHPLVILGSVLGLLALFLDPFASHAAGYSAGRMVLLFLTSLFLIPFPAMPERSFNLFSLNAPAWSLFWEYVATLFYALLLHRAGRRILLFLLPFAAAALLLVGYRSGNLLGGWSRDTFWDGGVRIAYSFLAGLVLFRYNWVIKNRLGFAGLSLLLLAAFLAPGPWWNWLAECITVLVYFPLLVSLGAGASLSTQWKKLCVFSGKISYPLYMTHYAVIWMFGNYYTANKPGAATLTFIVMAGTLLMVAFAYLVMKFYDTPVRAWLQRQQWKNKTGTPAK